MIATIYGWALHQAGHDVEFYVRPGRAAAYGDAADLDLFDVRRRVWGQRVTEKRPVRYREALEPDHDFDLIVLSVPHHRLTEAAAFLTPRVGQATVLALVIRRQQPAGRDFRPARKPVADVALPFGRTTTIQRTAGQ